MAVLRPGVLPSEGSRCLVGRELCPALQNGSLDAGMELVIQGFGRLSSRKGRRSVRGVCRKEASKGTIRSWSINQKGPFGNASASREARFVSRQRARADVSVAPAYGGGGGGGRRRGVL